MQQRGPRMDPNPVSITHRTRQGLSGSVDVIYFSRGDEW